jgi:hypothetical protein
MTSQRVRIFGEVIDDHGVLDRVDNIGVGDAVAAGGGMDLHRALLYYETPD